MKKTIKDLFKLITAIATVAGILYVARDQIKAIIAKIKEVSDDDFDDDFVEMTCPHCGETVYFDIDLIESDDELMCPNCNEIIIPADDEVCGCNCGCDEHKPE